LFFFSKHFLKCSDET